MLALHGVHVMRGGRTLHPHLDASIPPHSLTLITGPNGTGKTSLLRVMAGLTPPAGGQMTRHASHRLLQARPLPASTETVKDWVVTYLALMGQTGPAQGDYSHDDPFEVIPHFETPLYKLSSGWRQRVRLATFLWLAPRPLWLLDEPTTHLDAAAITLLQARITEHVQAGGGAVIATHQPEIWQDATQTLLMGGAI